MHTENNAKWNQNKEHSKAEITKDAWSRNTPVRKKSFFTADISFYQNKVTKFQVPSSKLSRSSFTCYFRKLTFIDFHSVSKIIFILSFLISPSQAQLRISCTQSSIITRFIEDCMNDCKDTYGGDHSFRSFLAVYCNVF